MIDQYSSYDGINDHSPRNDRMRYKHLQMDFQDDHLPHERLVGILEEIVNHAAATPPETLGGYASSDLRKEAAKFVKNLIPEDNHLLVDFTPEVVWVNIISRWDGKSNSEPGVHKRDAIPAVKLILANQIALESLVCKINDLLDAMEVAVAESDTKARMDLIPQVLIPALEAMRILGRIDMLGHIRRKEEISKRQSSNTLSIREQKKKYYNLAREFLLENGCQGKFRGVCGVADYLAERPEFIKRLRALNPKGSWWIESSSNGKPAMIDHEFFHREFRTWGKVDDTHGGWSEFKKKSQGRKR